MLYGARHASCTSTAVCLLAAGHFLELFTKLHSAAAAKNACLCSDEFGARMEAFRTYLRQRPEKVVAVVTHFGVLEYMTGHRFTNCEIWSCLWENGYCVAEHDGTPQ